MKKLFPVMFAATAMFSLFAEDALFNGGKLVPISSNCIETSTYHLNFSWAHRFSDGTIYLKHSTGLHAYKEGACSEYSTDNGVTWQKPVDGVVSGFNAYEDKEGNRCYVDCAMSKLNDVHTVTVGVRGKDNKFKKTYKVPVNFPYRTTVGFLHRDCIRLSDGRLLVPGYGRKENAGRQHNFVLESKDDGQTWQFLSMIAEDPNNKTAEGPDETTIVELKDKSILAIYRVHGLSPARQKRSLDGGKTWSEEEPSVSFGASPHAIKLSDGTLAVVTGRPDYYLFLDFSGTGKNYQKLCLYKGSTSAYGSIIETAPNEIAIFHDESDFGSGRNPSLFNRLVISRYKVVKDASIVSDRDERASDYDFFYTPASKKLPAAQGIVIQQGYTTKEKDDQAYLELIDIPEKPHPVLRMVSMRDGSVQHHTRYCNLRSLDNPLDIDKLKIDFEVRLISLEITEPQFHTSFIIGRKSDEKKFSGSLAVARDYIRYIDNGSWKDIPMDNSVGFHSFSIRADRASGTYQILRDNKPVVTAKFGRVKPGNNVSWGDGSGGFRGTVDIGYFGWKFN